MNRGAATVPWLMRINEMGLTPWEVLQTLQRIEFHEASFPPARRLIRPLG